MQFKPVINHVGRITDYVITNREEELVFNLGSFNRTNFIKPELFFVNLNGYISTLSDKAQQSIFNLYKEIKDTLESIVDNTVIHTSIKKLVTELALKINYKQLNKWFMVHGEVNIPDMEVTFKGDDSDLGRSLTYLRDEYLELTSLSLFFKFLTPVISQYLFIVGTETATKFKEYRVLGIFKNIGITDSKALNRLLEYIDATIERERRIKPTAKSSSAAVYGGLSTEEVPVWLLAKVLIRRLTVNEELAGTSLVANIYHTLDQQLRSLDKTFGGMVKDSKVTEKGGDDVNNTSIAENYKIKQTQNISNIVILEKFALNIRANIHSIDPTVPNELLAKYGKVKSKIPVDITEAHIKIMQLTLWKLIPVRAMTMLPLATLTCYYKVSCALFEHWGMTDLLSVFESNVVKTKDMGYGGGLRLRKEYLEKFERMCPYRQVTNKTSTFRSTNPALKTIDVVSGLLESYTWFNKVTDKKITGINFKTVIADLILKTYEI